MDKKLYDLMDWRRIEGIVYSDENQPHSFLGANITSHGVLVQAFLPFARSAAVKGPGISVEMECVDEEGFFAALLPGKTIPDYSLYILDEDGTERTVSDPYNYAPQIPEKVLKKFAAGICYNIYDYLGAHRMTADGRDGMYFAVWAPNAVRVSLVGDFNHWDGRVLPMRKLESYGIFELFVPGMREDVLYKFEVKASSGLTFLKSDPYGFAYEDGPGGASVTADLSSYAWGDDAWMKERTQTDLKSLPLSVYQIDPYNWRFMEEGGDRKSLNYRQLASELAAYVHEMGYTHVELISVMEHSDKGECRAATGFYAPDRSLGTSADFMFFVDYMHQHQIGVIIDWGPGHFSRDLNGLTGFDGTNLYEHMDPRQSLYAYDGSLMFNLGRPEVKNFLIACALFWAKTYHVDGLRLEDISRMLYLDFGKGQGQWVPNLYGGNENLEAVEFFRHLDSIFRLESDGAVLIAQDSSQWPMVTAPVEDGGLGFDFKWNRGFQDSLIDYMQLDPLFRGAHHSELIFSMVYNYSENFMLAFSIDDVSGKPGSMYSRVPGRKKTKLANLRVMYGYMMLHPGKKLFAMGCELAQKASLGPDSGVDWKTLEDEENLRFRSYCSALLHFYRENPALYALDFAPEGFEWINNISANENMLVFLRRSAIDEQMLLVVVNFSNLTYENHKIGVPFPGKYKEILNSDAVSFGGDGHVNPRVKNSRADECDELPDSIRITVPALGISIFRCTRAEDAVNEKKKKDTKASPAGSATAGRRKNKPAAAKPKKSLRDELEEKVRTEEHR